MSPPFLLVPLRATCPQPYVLTPTTGMASPFNLPQNSLSYTENFLYMMDRLSQEQYRPNPKLARALDILFILHVGMTKRRMARCQPWPDVYACMHARRPTTS